MSNADDWLKDNGKKPYSTEMYDDWYWATYLYYHGKVFTEEEIGPNEKDWTLPVPIWEHLQAKTTYPYAKCYHSENEALEDFRQAYDKAVAEGWTG